MSISYAMHVKACTQGDCFAQILYWLDRYPVAEVRRRIEAELNAAREIHAKYQEQEREKVSG